MPPKAIPAHAVRRLHVHVIIQSDDPEFVATLKNEVITAGGTIYLTEEVHGCSFSFCMPKGYENPLAKYMTQEKYLEKVMISEVDESEGVKEAAADLEEEED